MTRKEFEVIKKNLFKTLDRADQLYSNATVIEEEYEDWKRFVARSLGVPYIRYEIIRYQRIYITPYRYDIKCGLRNLEFRIVEEIPETELENQKAKEKLELRNQSPKLDFERAAQLMNNLVSYNWDQDLILRQMQLMREWFKKSSV